MGVLFEGLYDVGTLDLQCWVDLGDSVDEVGRFTVRQELALARGCNDISPSGRRATICRESDNHHLKTVVITNERQLS